MAIEGDMAGYDLPVYPFRRAPEQEAGARVRHPVVVVGAGLSGLVAAVDLAQRGVAVVVLDDDNTIGVRGLASRGICYARRTLEILDRLGVYDRIAAKGTTWQVGRVLAGDEVLYSFNLAPDEGQKHPPFINIQQFYVEWFLVDRLNELPHGEIRWRNEVVAVNQSDDHVVLSVETPAGAYEVEADWVLACDGAFSTVREALGVAAASETGEDRWCITDVRLAADFPTERWTWIEAPFNDNRGVWRHRMADGIWRLDFQMGPEADPAAISKPEVVRKRLTAMLGPEAEFEIVWIGPWTYRTYVVDRFKVGRIFLLGDAAHLMSPFGARGGNSGAQDADNLAWKLALVVQGRAPERLLDSYDAERRPAAQHNVKTTKRSARFMAPKGPAEQALRAAVVGLAGDFPFARRMLDAGRLSEPFDYAGTALIGPGAGAAAANAPVATADGGTSFLLDHLGPGFTLVLYGAEAGIAELEQNVTVLRVTAGTGDGQLRDRDGLVARRYGWSEFGAALIRPDGHLAARWSAPPTAADVDAAQRRATAQSS